MFIFAVACAAFAQGLFDSSFNNFLNERFSISNSQRALLEVPREIPGLIVIFVSALFFFICNRRLAFLSFVIAGFGILFIGTMSPTYNIMLIWVFMHSVGQHIFLPLSSDIGMELAKEGQMGKRLGQLQGAANFAGILGFLLVFAGFKYFNFSFTKNYIIAAIFYFIGAVFMFLMQKNKPTPAMSRFKLKKEYKLFYILTILYGTRKQIFLTFAPWVLVTVFMRKTQNVATLLAIGGLIGIWFKPMLGHIIDKYGEKTVLAGEAIVLVFVCFGYGFAKKLFGFEAALIIASACYIADQLLMSVSMARATYLKKIAVDPADVTSTLTAAVSIDHIFSLAIAVLGGIIWQMFGYEYIFITAGLISIVNLYFALKIKSSVS